MHLLPHSQCSCLPKAASTVRLKDNARITPLSWLPAPGDAAHSSAPARSNSRALVWPQLLRASAEHREQEELYRKSWQHFRPTCSQGRCVEHEALASSAHTWCKLHNMPQAQAEQDTSPQLSYYVSDYATKRRLILPRHCFTRGHHSVAVTRTCWLALHRGLELEVCRPSTCMARAPGLSLATCNMAWAGPSCN